MHKFVKISPLNYRFAKNVSENLVSSTRIIDVLVQLNFLGANMENVL